MFKIIINRYSFIHLIFVVVFSKYANGPVFEAIEAPPDGDPILYWLAGKLWPGILGPLPGGAKMDKKIREIT